MSYSAPLPARDHTLATKLVHVGSEPDAVTGAVVTPISLATTYAQASPGSPAGAGSAHAYGAAGFEYSRTSNPTRNAFEAAVAAAEGGTACAAFGSGLAATVAVLHALACGGVAAGARAHTHTPRARTHTNSNHHRPVRHHTDA